MLWVPKEQKHWRTCYCLEHYHSSLWTLSLILAKQTVTIIIHWRSNTGYPFKWHHIASSSCCLWSTSRVGTLTFVIYSRHRHYAVHLVSVHHPSANDNLVYSPRYPAECANSAECAFLRVKVIDCVNADDMQSVDVKTIEIRCSPVQLSLWSSSDWTIDICIWSWLSWCIMSCADLCAFFNDVMSMSNRVNRHVWSYYYKLHQNKSICHSVIKLLNFFIISRVDYCNSVQANMQKYQLNLF